MRRQASLADSGPLIALIDGDDPHHERRVDALKTLTPPLITTWAVVAEAMYRLHQVAGLTAQHIMRVSILTMRWLMGWSHSRCCSEAGGGAALDVGEVYQDDVAQAEWRFGRAGGGRATGRAGQGFAHAVAGLAMAGGDLFRESLQVDVDRGLHGLACPV